MATTKEVIELETELPTLREDQLIFVIRALLVAGHVSVHTLNQAINLARTIRADQ